MPGSIDTMNFYKTKRFQLNKLKKEKNPSCFNYFI